MASVSDEIQKPPPTGLMAIIKSHHHGPTSLVKSTALWVHFTGHF